MLADVSHELKTPLTAMLGYVETLHMADVALDDATRDRYFETLERETRRLDRIVRDLLDLARLENGIGPLDARVFTIARVFEHVIQRHEQESRSRDIAVRVAIDDQADQVTADPDRIEQAVENLFANALRHTSSGGRLRAEVEASAGAGLHRAERTCRGRINCFVGRRFGRRHRARARAVSSSIGSTRRIRARVNNAERQRAGPFDHEGDRPAPWRVDSTSTASPAEPRSPSFCRTSSGDETRGSGARAVTKTRQDEKDWF